MRLYGKLSGTTTAVSWPKSKLVNSVGIHITQLGFVTGALALLRTVDTPQFVTMTMYCPKFLVHKTKQRLTKMTQMRIRMRKLALKTREKIMITPRKEKKREARREEKAEKAAVLDKSIEKELLERLKRGVYGDIYNYPADKYNEILDKDQLATSDVEDDEEEAEIEYVEGYEELEEEDDMEDFGGLPIAKSHADDDDDDDEDTVAVDRKRMRRESSLALRKLEKEPGAKLKKARVLVEVRVYDYIFMLSILPDQGLLINVLHLHPVHIYDTLSSSHYYV
ncbi:hypothetical protein QYF36_005330 [Acer negundo]|nr:hypothetical protein QYF36_005330 [Acer negundo]